MADLDVGLPRHPAVGRIGADPDRLTALAAAGLTNREVAHQLFLAVKTVEANIARVYRKLGIRSRAELGQRMGDGL